MGEGTLRIKSENDLKDTRRYKRTRSISIRPILRKQPIYITLIENGKTPSKKVRKLS